MSATTIAVATMTETVDPPAGSRSGHAGLPVSVTAMSVHASGRVRRARDFSSCRQALLNSSNVNNDLNLDAIYVTKYRVRWPRYPGPLRHREKTAPSHNQDTISCCVSSFRWGVFRKLNVA